MTSQTMGGKSKKKKCLRLRMDDNHTKLGFKGLGSECWLCHLLAGGFKASHSEPIPFFVRWGCSCFI